MQNKSNSALHFCLNVTADIYFYNVSLFFFFIYICRGNKQTLTLRVNCNHSPLSCFTLLNCLWILNRLKYMNICISLPHFLLDTHTHSVSQPTPGTDKGSFMFAGLSWGQWVLMLRASFTRTEWGWRRNERKPYISRCYRVKEVLLVYNSFLDSFLQHYRDKPPLASYLAHLLHSCLLSERMDNSLLGVFWIIHSAAHIDKKF